MIPKYIITIAFSLLSWRRIEQTPVKDNNFIIGKWTSCSYECFQNGVLVSSIMANVCTTIIFNPDHSGIVKNPGQISSFTWTAKNDTIKINHPKIKGDNYLKSGPYTLIYKDSTAIHHLRLLSAKRDVAYILGN